MCENECVHIFCYKLRSVETTIKCNDMHVRKKAKLDCRLMQLGD